MNIKSLLKNNKNKSSQNSPNWAVCKVFRIKSKDGEPYLTRLRILQTPGFGVYLHKIYREDFDKFPHDHPWTFWSFILRGGYCESIYKRKTDLILLADGGRYTYRGEIGNLVERKQFSLHKHDLNTAHRITTVKTNTWTLVFVGKRNQEGWGFWTDTGWIHWKDYLAAQSHPQAEL